MKTAVIGGGSIGLAAALVCERAGHEVTVFDPSGFEDFDTSDEINARVWALGPSATDFLSELGVLFSSERICPYRSMRVIDARSDAKVAFFDPQLGHVVEADLIRKLLLKRVAQTKIKCLAKQVIQASKTGSLQLENGQQVNAQFVIFAEGRQAHAACSSGFEKIEGDHRQRAVVGTLKCTLPHNFEAFQIFTDVGPLALLPLPENSGEPRISVVWSLPTDLANQWCQWTPEQLAAHISKKSEWSRGELEFVGTPVWISISQHALKQDALGCCLALGDTAHGILPLAGLGANLGFGDVIALDDALCYHPKASAEQIARAVARERRFEHRTVAMMMELFSDAFRSDRPICQLARSFAFRTADRYPMIRRLVQEFVG